MNKVVYIFLSLIVTFKSFPVLVFFCIQDKSGNDIIINKCTQKGVYTCVNLDEVELQKIKSAVNDDVILINWCREISKKNIDLLDEEKLKKVFGYDYAYTLDFLIEVFYVSKVSIYFKNKDFKFTKKINGHKEFLSYIDSVDKSKCPYLYICFSVGSVKVKELIGENEKLIDAAYKLKNSIINDINNICVKYLDTVKLLDVTKKVNFYEELTNEINSYFDKNDLKKFNLTGISFVNDPLKKEIEELKNEYVKMCKNVIDEKMNELHKKKYGKENKKTEIGFNVTNIGTTSSKTGGVNNNLTTAPINTTNKSKYTHINPKNTLNNFGVSSKINDNKTISTITAPKINSSKINSHKFDIPVDINNNINNTDTATINNKHKTTTDVDTGAKPTTSTVADNINKTEVDNDLIKGSETSDGSTTTTSKFGGCCSSCRNNGK